MSWLARLKLAWIWAVHTGDRLLLWFVRCTLFPRTWLWPGKAEYRRILIFRIGNIGDILVTLPALDAIRARFPAAHITLLTSPGREGAPGAEHLLPQDHWFDDLLVYYTPDIRSWKGRWQLLRRLRRRRIDLFIELSNQLSRPRDELRNMMFARLAGCSSAWGFEVSQHRFFLREQALHVPHVQEPARIYRSVSSKLSLAPYRDPLLPISDSSRSEIAALLFRHGILRNEPYVVVHAGAKRQTNRWPAERFAYVAGEIARRWGIRVVLTGSPSELALVQHIAGLMRETPTVLCGQLDLPLLAALLQRSSLYIGNDTGAMHLAAAAGTPTVSIFSARDFPNVWYPSGLGHIVLRRDVPCSPCFKEVCDQDLICLKAIGTEDVLSAVERQLERLNVPAAREAGQVRDSESYFSDAN